MGFPGEDPSWIDRDENGNATLTPDRLAQLKMQINPFTEQPFGDSVRGPIRPPEVEAGRGTYLSFDPDFQMGQQILNDVAKSLSFDILGDVADARRRGMTPTKCCGGANTPPL